MTIFARTIAAAVLVVGFAATPSYAQFAPQSVDAGGSVTQEIKVENNLGFAIGQDAVAIASVCSIYEGVRIGGNVRQKCDVENNLAFAIGNRVTAHATVGGIGVPKLRH